MQTTSRVTASMAPDRARRVAPVLVEMPDFVECHKVAVLVGQGDDHVLEPLAPARVRLVSRQLPEGGGDVGMALHVRHDVLFAPKEAVVAEAGLLDRFHKVRPDLVVPSLVLGLLARIQLEGETEMFHGAPLASESVPRYLLSRAIVSEPRDRAP